MVTSTYCFAVGGFCLLIGLAAGLFLTRFYLKHPDGVLKVDTRDPNKDAYSLELTTPLDDIPNRKIVVFSVEVIK